MKRLSAGVVGAGAFATYHARQYKNLGRVDLAGVWDPNTEAAQKLADKVKSGNAFDLNDFLSQISQMKKMGGLSGLMDKLPTQMTAKAGIGR